MQHSNQGEAALDDIRVLIADDHDIVCNALDAFLLAYGMQPVGIASNGAEAVKLCGELRPDVVLMDLVMPEMDGLTATRIIRRRWPETRVIALTSYEEEHLAHKAQEAGASTFLLKNLSADGIAYAIREVYAGRPIAFKPTCDADLCGD